MVSINTLPPIPWSHQKSDFGSVWQWDTPVFEVVVNGDQRSFYWVISDKSANPTSSPRPFADGQVETFEQAERSIRETIGKSYPVQVGYYHYAGNLATTFMIASGDRVDLGIHVGRRVAVRVASREGGEEVYRGIAKIEHYDFVLIDGEEKIRITPSFIVSVIPEGGGQRTGEMSTNTGLKPRTIQGFLIQGCTGRLGVLPGTVEHFGNTCPLHEL